VARDTKRVTFRGLIKTRQFEGKHVGDDKVCNSTLRCSCRSAGTESGGGSLRRVGFPALEYGSIFETRTLRFKVALKTGPQASGLPHGTAYRPTDNGIEHNHNSKQKAPPQPVINPVETVLLTFISSDPRSPDLFGLVRYLGVGFIVHVITRHR